MDTEKPTIYEAIGGEDALVKVVHDFYMRVLDDPQLAPFFAGVNMNRIQGRQVEFFSSVLGGPHTYSGAPMRLAHQGRGIRQEHFDRVASHLAQSLQAAGVPHQISDQIMGAVAPLAGEIVSAGV